MKNMNNSYLSQISNLIHSNEYTTTLGGEIVFYLLFYYLKKKKSNDLGLTILKHILHVKTNWRFLLYTKNLSLNFSRFFR